MLKAAMPLAVAVSLTATAAAAAQLATPSPLMLQTSGTASQGKGSARHPVPVSVGYDTKATTADGTRPESWSTINNAWGGVVSRGKFFPKCTAAEIDAAQSDTGCPKGSLVGSGSLDSLVGPEGDFLQAGIPCHKDVRVYNGGQNKTSVLLVGPPEDCAGVSYLPPFPAVWSTSGGIGGGQSLNNAIPPNISHPLPGVLGSPTSLAITFKKQTVKVKGKRRGYLESIGCKGTRKFSQLVIGDPSGQKNTTTSTAGPC